MKDNLPPLPEWFAKASPQLHNDVRNYARAAIEKYRAECQSVPAGYVLVPIEPTREIENAIGWAKNLKASEIWADALAAAPQPQPVQQDQCPECNGTGTCPTTAKVIDAVEQAHGITEGTT